MAVTLNASTTTGLVQSADTSGTVEIQSNGTTRLTVASGGVTTTGNTSIANLTATGTFGGGVITSGTAVASTSGTSIDFTSIPSWVKRITVMFNGVSTSGSSQLQVQIGSGSVTTTGYNSVAFYGLASAVQFQSATTGFILEPSGNAASSTVRYGSLILSSFGSNTWASQGMIFPSVGATLVISDTGISPALGGTLDRIRITTLGGTDTFDAGSINILYEG
jgi:hypothetical protein